MPNLLAKSLTSNAEEELFFQLLYADDEDDVIQILDENGYPMSNKDVWTPLGNNYGNFSTVGNQQENASAALIEKLINSIDAVLISECYQAGIDPESIDAPNSMQDAVEQFLGVKEGRMDYLSTSQQTELADRIHFVAMGSKISPSYCIIDQGEGQTPNQFPKTFLSTTQSSPKAKINFVQGKFNSGSTGSLQFCGKQNIQLIISRRQPHAPVEQSDDSRDMWGFTIIRRRRPGHGYKSSVFEYLAPGGTVLRFPADYIRVLPGSSRKNQPAQAYSKDLHYGTCVKLYNYRWKGRSIATTESRRQIERFFQTPCLPLRISETRSSYRANFYSATVIGIWNTVRMDDIDSDDYKMEKGFPAWEELSLRDIGKLTLHIGVWKESIDTSRYPTGVYFLVNGQVHESYGRDFVTRRLKLDYIDKHLLVAVDCTGIDRGVWEDLSMGSRDRFRKNEESELIKSRLAEELKEHPGLKELNAFRRQKRRDETQETPESVVSTFNDLLKKDPGLATFFGVGGKLLTGTGPGGLARFEGRKFPSYFRLIKKSKKGLKKTCPINRTVKVEFETDAENGYFKRPDEPGTIKIEPTPNIVEASRLWNGRFSVKFRVPWDAKPGDSFLIRVLVSDVTRVSSGPFACEFTLIASEAVDRVPPSGKPNPHLNPKAPKPTNQATSLAVPEPIEVKKDRWEHFGFSNQQEALIIKRSEGDGYDFYLNVDNSTLVTEMSNPKQDPALVKHWFKWGLVISSLAMIRQQEENKVSDSDDESDPESGPDLLKIKQACDGLSRVIIPIIRSLHEGP